MSSSTHSTTRCYACDEIGHSASKCPSIGIPPLSFGKGTGGGVHQHDDGEEEHIDSIPVWGTEDDKCLYLNSLCSTMVEQYEGYTNTGKHFHKAPSSKLWLGEWYIHMPYV